MDHLQAKNHRLRILSSCSQDCFHCAVIVAMGTMRMVKMTFHQIVGVVTVWNCLVSAGGTVLVALLVRSAVMLRCARCRVCPAYADLVLVNVVSMHMVKVPIVNIVLMAIMLHNRMSAVRTMYVRMRFVNLMIAHFLVLL